MAEIIRVNGGVLGGVNVDTDVGSLVSFNGSQPKAFAIVVKNGSGVAQALGNSTPGNTTNEAGVNESIERIFFTLLTRATIIYYQVEDDDSGQISVMMEANAGGWTAAEMQTAIRALGTEVGANDVDVTGTTVTDLGLKLATS